MAMASVMPAQPVRDGNQDQLFRPRTYATSALTSSSDKVSNGFINVLSSSLLSPSLIALNALSSLMSAWTFASVKSLTPSLAPILVAPLPSSPWHLAQRLAQFSFASAPETAV